MKKRNMFQVGQVYSLEDKFDGEYQGYAVVVDIQREKCKQDRTWVPLPSGFITLELYISGEDMPFEEEFVLNTMLAPKGYTSFQDMEMVELHLFTDFVALLAGHKMEQEAF